MVEIVWDAERTATATTGVGASIQIGDHAPFSPDDLLALAVAGCLMRTCFALVEARGVNVLSYASSARTAPACSGGEAPAIVIHIYIGVATPADQALVEVLAAQSIVQSPLARALAPLLSATTEVRSLDPTESEPGPMRPS
jgi:organic hydroperoxide reductase OsmC/OhrA